MHIDIIYILFEFVDKRLEIKEKKIFKTRVRSGLMRYESCGAGSGGGSQYIVVIYIVINVLHICLRYTQTLTMIERIDCFLVSFGSF